MNERKGSVLWGRRMSSVESDGENKEDGSRD